MTHSGTIQSYAYYKEVFKGKSLPYAFVDMDFMNQNIKEVVQRVNQNKTIRIASKSIRCKYVLKHILSYGTPYAGIMAYHPKEAYDLSQYGFDDILLGYPVFDEGDIGFVLNEIYNGKTIRFMCDHIEQIKHLNRLANFKGVVAEFLLDIDMSTDFPGLHFGVYRSPLHNLEDVKNIYKSITSLKNVRLVGIMGYEAQIAGLGDNVTGKQIKNKVIRMLKYRSIKDVSERRKAIVNWLKNEGADLKIVNAGGTGSLETSSSEPWVTEVTAGSAFYSSGLFDSYEQFKHKPAAGFGIEITRIPKKGMYTCYGGGYIASGEIGISKQPLPYLPEGIELIKSEGCGEVQTPITYKGKEKLEIGNPVYFRHAKAGELCERFNALFLVENGVIIDQVLTYRGEGNCYV